MTSERQDPTTVEISEPEKAATGIPAIVTTMQRSLIRMGPVRTARTLAIINQPEGFDCPGCAWPEPVPDERKKITFCESGAKAVAEEATRGRAGREFFSQHDLADLRERTDHWLGESGRLIEPMLKKSGGDYFEPIAWDAAFRLISERLHRLASPDEAVFYTSGRASNEAAYVYQLMVRCFGTNNLPDCSNMCHEPTGAALDETIGIGKGSVRLSDFEEADLIIIAGQNPGTNHPRMLAALEDAKMNGAKIIAINPLPEAGLLRFKNPQRPRGILGDGVKLADIHLPIRLGADHALFQLWNKRIVEESGANPDLVDFRFVERYTHGFDRFAQHLRDADAEQLLADTGLDAAAVDTAYEMVAGSQRTIICWAMGITQHRNSVETISEMVNTLLLGGHIGREGAGVCPVRGHSNVQGDRTVGVWEKIQPELFAAMESEFGITMPTEEGFDTVDAVSAFADGRAKVFVGLGGNFVRATPDTGFTEQAFSNIDLMVNLATKLNRSHLVNDGDSLILPVLGRTEIDKQKSGPQFVTVEDSMGMVHSSTGVLEPPSAKVKSEVAILCGLAEVLLGKDHAVGWRGFAANYDVIRDHIGNTVEGFEDFNRRVRKPGGFELPHPPRDSRTFKTETGKAGFTTSTVATPSAGSGELMLQTLRSHDQYNTTIYGHDDRYRGLSGDRRIIMLNPSDIKSLGIAERDRVDVHCALPGPQRVARQMMVVSYPTPVGTAAAYFPEANVLIPLDHHDPVAQTPASKSIPIRIVPH